MVPAIGILTFAVCGFGLMYPEGHWTVTGLFGFKAFGLSAPGGSPETFNGAFTYWTMFFFQSMFAATAATIVSGAVAERVKLNSFLIFTLIYVAVVYPVIGSWGWGGGFLDKMKFHDFAGSTFVHSVGGWGALAGVILLGPRIGKFVNGHSMPIMGHSMPLATIGVFMLWFGWFGFNGRLRPERRSDYGLLCAGHNNARRRRRNHGGNAYEHVRPEEARPFHDIERVSRRARRNHGRGGLRQHLLLPSSIGAVAGIIVVLAVLFFDRLKLDDPVGALSVHLCGGIWGTLAVGIFSTNPAYTFLTQFTGVACAAVSFPCALAIFYVLKKTIGIRVSEDEELRGLDLGEHGMEAYAGFQIFSNQ